MQMTKSRSRWQPIAHGKSKAEIRSKGLVFDAFLQMSKSNFCFFFPSRFEDACLVLMAQIRKMKTCQSIPRIILRSDKTLSGNWGIHQKYPTSLMHKLKQEEFS